MENEEPTSRCESPMRLQRKRPANDLRKNAKESKRESQESNDEIKSSNSSATPEPASTGSDRSDIDGLSSPEHVTLFWFTEAALRLHDNAGLKAAMKDCKAVRFCYFLDERFINESSPRWKFIKSALSDLDEQLKNLGSRLHVLSGQPSERLPQLFADWNVVRLGFSAHPGCTDMRRRDRAIVSLALRHGVEVVYRDAPQCLYSPLDIIKASGGMPPLTFPSFVGVASQLPEPEKPINVPQSDIVMCSVSEDHDEAPQNEILGKKDLDFPWAGGETEARARFMSALRHWLINRETQSTPDLRAVTPYIVQGCLSVRQVYHDVNRVYEEIQGEKATLKLHFAALHRDFLYNLAVVPNDDLNLDVSFDCDEARIRTWLEGNTGFPWVDAVMRQFRTEGWVAPTLRQAVLWFLTRGVLWQTPEIAVQFMSEFCLLDLPLAKGYAAWASGTGAWCENDVAHKCPKVDPSYIRQWVPEVANLTDEQIHEPWTTQTPTEYVSLIVQHKISHRRSESKYHETLKRSSGKLLSRLDKLGREKTKMSPLNLEPNPWEDQKSQMDRETYLRFLQKVQNNWSH